MKELNRLIDYIEEHLTSDIQLSEVAKQSGISEYHLKRTFSFVAGITLSEYIKNRRLACANVDLVNGASATVTAFAYGYQTLEGFSRAFRDWSGYLPSEVKKSGVCKSYPKFTFHLEVTGGNSMDYRIEEKGTFAIVGVSKRVPIQFVGVNSSIVELAKAITEEQKEEMHRLGDLAPNQVVNASFQFDEGRMEEKGALTHMIGFLTSKIDECKGLEQRIIPGHTWAIFPNQGSFPEVLQTTMANIFSEWLPNSGYELVEAPEISFTKWLDQGEAYSEVWIAVTKRHG
ncbi:AraC family transcriptional regulator [Enterococcus mundtii]|uniref:AraC family transcriptional regulator n=1 Tax=Enterococcus mundtii TaxID=53346 RepID=UPI000CF112A4|nr:AraC family transcriptional regulator [Enterococcus mundtii]PQC27049.1 AraC family transcriptional regulator [Enterococcus mundtii]PTO37859.1 AraC family transcriptional regulator [Enterococcus mundtii]PTO41706.1 AraC family transcriptional regulator [Enterococcus mundtii]